MLGLRLEEPCRLTFIFIWCGFDASRQAEREVIIGMGLLAGGQFSLFFILGLFY